MGKPLVVAAVSGLVALVTGLLLGFVLHGAIDPSPSQTASTRLEEQVTLAVGSDNRQHPPQQQVQSLAILVGQRIVDAAVVYPQADAVSQDRIQRNIERVLHAGLLEHIPYADKRALSIQHALCLRENPRDVAALTQCLRQALLATDGGKMTASVSFGG